RDGDDVCGVVLRVRDGKLIARDHWFLENAEHETEGSILSAFLVRCYLPLEVRARKVLLPFPPAPQDLASLGELAPEVDWHVPQRGTKAQLAELAGENARCLLGGLKIEGFDIAERSADPVFALGRDLGLAAVPRAFVCIDISTNQGRDTVGSLVWFEAGRPKKAEYRRFRITGAPQDDFAAVHEVVTRYLARRIAEAKPVPDLTVIDGGKGQLGAALDAARALGQETLPIVSLAKREEEVFLPAQSEPLRLSRRSPSLKLLQRARDEAHRFAVSYSRKRRAQRTITSELLAVPGIGPARRRALLERFGSLAGVKTATPAEIAALPGFSTRLVELRRLGAKYGLRELALKDEGTNPTGSFKARGLSAAVTRAVRGGAQRLVVPTAGNAGIALAAYAARAGASARVYAPESTPPTILAQIRAFGAELLLVDGHIGDCGTQARAYAAEVGAVDVSTLREPYRIEGKKTLGLELAEQGGWTLPDAIVYPTGGVT